MKIKIPNYLTIGRIIIVPIFVFTFYLPGFYGDVIPFALFVIASFTDFLDGLLARMFKEESKLGELLDPIADKIIVATALILLVMDGTIKNYEVIAAIIILTRDRAPLIWSNYKQNFTSEGCLFTYDMKCLINFTIF